MNLTKITLTNFLSHKFTAVDFPDGLTGILGLNGSGKSSLVIDAVTWGLWGKSRVSGAGDDLIRHGASECEVALELEVNGILYAVSRVRTKNRRTQLFLEKQEAGHLVQDISRAVLKDTQEDINRLLGMTYEVFKNSCCIEQGNIGSFSELTPTEASKVLSSILQLDKYVQYTDVAMSKFMDAKTGAGYIEVNIANLEERLDKAKDIDKVKQIEISKVDQLKSALESATSKYTKALNQFNNLTNNRENVSKDSETIKSELSDKDKGLLRIDKQLKLLEKINGNCPVCKNDLDADHKQTIITSLEAEKYMLESNQKHLEGLKDSYHNKFLKVTTEMRSLKLDDKKDKVIILDNKLNQIQAVVDTLEKTSENVETIQNKLKENSERLVELDKLQTIYSELASAFKPKGIPLLIIDNVISELQILINETLQVLSDLPITIEITTQREGVSGDTLDTFQILIRDGNKIRPYFNYSGGEKTIIDLSIRLGLSELLARRNNFKIETLIIDEGLGTLDDTNQTNFIETLIKLTSKFKKIIVITHTPVKDYFKQAIQLKKNNGISTVDQSGLKWYNSISERTHGGIH